MNKPDISTRKEADQLRAELKTAEPAYRMEPTGPAIDEEAVRRQQFKANRMRDIETRLHHSSARFRKDSRHPFNRDYTR